MLSLYLMTADQCERNGGLATDRDPAHLQSTRRYTDGRASRMFYGRNSNERGKQIRRRTTRVGRANWTCRKSLVCAEYLTHRCKNVLFTSFYFAEVFFLFCFYYFRLTSVDLQDRA